MVAETWFPPDWLDPKAGDAATDLDLALLLVNSYDALAEPPDRLQDLRWLSGVLARVGHGALARELRAGDLDALRDLRAGLRAAFEATDVAAAVTALNPMLSASASAQLLVASPEEPSGVRLESGVGTRGLSTLQARLPLAVARHIARFGVGRLGTCGSEPCRCAFVDRTRAGTKRYCCVWCNDRSAARAYRRRNRSPGSADDEYKSE